MKKNRLLYDCLRAPYDAAHIIQIAKALGNCEIYFSGNCIDINRNKIKSKIESWGITELPPIKYYKSLLEAAEDLHSQGMNLVGTTPRTNKDFYDLDLNDGNNVIVFGTEGSGLTKLKMSYLDDLVKLPMGEGINFLTLPVATSAIAYEINRQFRLK